MSQLKYFLRGIYRIGKFAVLPTIVFNIIGYWFMQAMPYIPSELLLIDLNEVRWPSTFLGRALLLSFFGVIYSGATVILICLAIAIPLALYGLILYIGGYYSDHPSEKVKHD
ncbi:hypothetical protein R3Q56_006736 [Pseudomonas aeruginosa]|nr:hypothetical protein [Pseudomonas aeruginosa]ELR2942364.1 hypothetical protein [Pseudomonas aeruginosa]